MTAWPRNVLLGGLALLWLPLALSSRSVQPAHSWPGPSGTVWAGTELWGLEVWSRGGVTDNVLELRCQRSPLLRTRLNYWPGPEWRGWAEWKAEKAIHVPAWGAGAKPKIGVIIRN